MLLEKHQAVDSVYLDYSKAFDKCDHNVMLDKLHSLGIQGKINTWVEGFLKQSQQIVVVRGAKSKAVWCTSGVPQGSVLGPLLCLILMHDITKGIHHAISSHPSQMIPRSGRQSTETRIAFYSRTTWT